MVFPGSPTRPTIAIQGNVASFHDIARRRFFGDECEIISCRSFKDVFHRLADGAADYAICAIENSLYGSINEVYDLLLRYRLWIAGEVVLRISHHLIGLAGVEIADLTEVHSHPIALAQCEDFLETRLGHVERFEHFDTAGAVADVKRWNDPRKSAIAGKYAADRYELEVLASGVETNKQNYTRFMVLARGRIEQECDKTSIILRTAHEPGALYRALGVFDRNEINLTKLESRPVMGRAWHYMFYLDFEAGVDDPRTVSAFDELRRLGDDKTVLGSYRSGANPEVDG